MLADRFSIKVLPARERVIVVPSGEVDLSTAPDVSARMAELRERGFEHFVLDLRAVTFIDSTGLQMLIDEKKQASGNGGTLVVLYQPGPVMQLLDLSGLLDRFPMPVSPNGRAERAVESWLRSLT